MCCKIQKTIEIKFVKNRDPRYDSKGIAYVPCGLHRVQHKLSFSSVKYKLPLMNPLVYMLTVNDTHITS